MEGRRAAPPPATQPHPFLLGPLPPGPSHPPQSASRGQPPAGPNPLRLTVCLSVLRGRSSCVPVLSLQTLATADLLYAVPLLLGRLHGDGASAAGVLGPLGMQVHGKRDVRRPSGLSGGSLSFRELPERTSSTPGDHPTLPTGTHRRRASTMGAHGDEWRMPGPPEGAGWPREALSRGLHVYSLYTVLYALSVTRRARAEHLYGARSDYL